MKTGEHAGLERGRGPLPAAVDIPPGFWERDSTHFPRPLSPAFRSSVLPAHNQAIRQACEILSAPIETVAIQEIGGWVYQRTVPLGGKDRRPPPVWLMAVIIRLMPQMRARIKGMVQTVRRDTIGSFITRWYEEWKPAQMKRITQLRAVDLASLADEELERHVLDMVSFIAESLKLHSLVGLTDFVVAELAFTCRDLLGWDDRRTFELLSGLSEAASEPSHRLALLAEMAKNQPAVLKLLESIDRETATRLTEAAPDFAAAFNNYQQKFGCRTLSFEVAVPTIEETPLLTLALLRNQVLGNYDPAVEKSVLEQRRISALGQAQKALAGRSDRERERFDRALTRARRAYPIREDHEFYLTQAPLALLRYALLELGTRLAERGLISRRDDVFFLEVEEAFAASRANNDCRSLVKSRQDERAWVEAHPGPASYGKPPGPPPSSAPFPREARAMIEAMYWWMERMLGLATGGESLPEAKTLKGTAAAPGRYTGVVRVILNETEFGKIQAGDVLVCPTTSPVWSLLFSSIGALVTDAGGILSHPAIIAREYGLPSVVATGNATQHLKDGQTVTVDGNAGIVEVLA